MNEYATTDSSMVPAVSATLPNLAPFSSSNSALIIGGIRGARGSSRARFRQQPADTLILLRPQLRNPVLETLAESGVVLIAAGIELVRNGQAAHFDDDLMHPAGHEVPEAAGAFRIDDGDVQQRIDLLAQRRQAQRHAAGLGLEQETVRRTLLVVLGPGEARAFEEIEDGHRHIAEVLTGGARGFQILAAQLGV